MPDLSTNRTKLNPYAQVTYHKGYVHDKVRYPVLAVKKLDAKTKEVIRAAFKPLVTGEEAERFVFVKDPHTEKTGHELGWSFVWLDGAQRTAGLLRKNGVGVALYYKRLIVNEEPAPGDPLPEGWIREPIDAWVRTDLLGRSAREANLFIKKKHEAQAAEIRLLKQQLDARQVIADSAETDKTKAQMDLEALTKYKDRLLEKLSVITDKISVTKIKKWMEDHQREKDRKAKRKQRAAARAKEARKHYKPKGTKGKKKWDQRGKA